MSLQDIIATPDDQRDIQWEFRFLDAFPTAKLKILSPEPQEGPDGWPYLMAEIDEQGTEPAPKVLQWLSDRGIGLVVNPTKSYPDYVFNYGMIWHFREHSLFMRPQDEMPPATLELKPGQGLLAGPPSPEYLPERARKVLRDFFRDQGLLAVKVLVMSQDRKHFDLAVSLESLGLPPEPEHQGIGEAIAWFLPPHYSLVLVSEKGLPEFSAL